MGCAHSSASGSNAREPEKQAGPVLLGPQPLSKKCVIADSSETGSPDVETFAVLRVLRGELNRSFDSYGKMDPFAIVEWIEPDGTRKKLSTTRTDWNAHMSPVWDHTCRGQPFKSRDDQVEFQVMEGNVIGRPTFCGSARISMGELLGEMAASFSPSEQGTFAGPVLDLALRNAEEVTGSVKVQALLVCRAQSDGASVPGGSLTKVDPSLFEKDIEQLGVSGGSAPFFKLRLREAKERRPDHFIGKDLSHAEDEVLFYEQALALRQQPGAGGLAGLLRFTFEYAGVLSNDESTCDAAKGRELLVMKNLRSGREQLRLLDIKIGQKTAQAGWQGKSRAAALRQSLVDGITNSSCEGFRVEGFDGRPPALSSMDPLLDLGMTGNAKMLKKADRIMLQRMTGAEMLMHFLDVHQEPIDVPDAAMQEVLTPIEIAEIVAHEVVSRLAQLAIACRRSPAPQKWIGSSVGLGFDAGHLPPRAQGEGQLRKAVLVNIFDWGRSELNTFESHMSLSDKDQHDRCEFWRYYIGGIDRLAWEAARAYRHRFACTRKWSHITFKISDFDSMSENDFIGKLTVAVEETPETTAELMRHSGNQVVSDYGIRGCSTLTYSIAWRAYPKGSRLRGAWQIHVARANKLPRQDKIQLRTTSDPLCEITAVSEGSVHCFRQVSSVKVKNLDPEWGETFHLPVASEAGALEAALEEAASGLGTAVSRIFPPELMPQWQKEGPTLGISSAKSHSRWSWSETASPSEADEQAKVLTSWKLRLDAASATDSASSPSWRGDNEESVAGGRTLQLEETTNEESVAGGRTLQLEEMTKDLPMESVAGGRTLQLEETTKESVAGGRTLQLEEMTKDLPMESVAGGRTLQLEETTKESVAGGRTLQLEEMTKETTKAEDLQQAAEVMMLTGEMAAAESSAEEHGEIMPCEQDIMESIAIEIFSEQDQHPLVTHLEFDPDEEAELAVAPAFIADGSPVAMPPIVSPRMQPLPLVTESNETLKTSCWWGLPACACIDAER